MSERAQFLMQETLQLLKLVRAFSRAADSVVADFFRARKKLGKADRALLSDIVYCVLRNWRFLESLAGNRAQQIVFIAAFLEKRKDFEPLYSEQEKIFFQNFNLQTYQKTLPAAVFYSFPDWLFKAFAENLKAEQVRQLCQILNQKAPLDCRINPLKTNLEEVLNAFPQAKKMAFSPLGFRLEEKQALWNHPLFLEGKIEVQDEGSQLVGLLTQVQRREMVADFCAGAGGKALLLGAMMKNTGMLYAMDVSEKRLQQFKMRFKRSGLSNVHFLRIENEHDSRLKRLKNRFDCVLVDAPCSGTGTLRRNPDLKWRQNPEKIEKLNVLQLSILSAAANLVKPGGRLIYATCSLLRSENENIGDWFLAQHPEFTPLNLQTVPRSKPLPDAIFNAQGQLSLWPFHGTDGFFAAGFVKK